MEESPNYLASSNIRVDEAAQPLTHPFEPAGNHGWDNEQNDLILYSRDILCNDVTQHTYIVVEKLGQGTFGQVVKCWSYFHQRFVAVKIIKNQTAYFQQALVEVKILQTLNRNYNPDRYNFVRFQDYFRCKSHLCLVFELLQRNLFELIRCSGYRGFSLSLVRHFVKQILQTLKVLNQERIIHGDLKPENVLLEDESSGTVKVIDFGSSCMEHETVYSYIQSRFYRSPEVVLAHPYDAAIDIWSLGCIAAELFLGLPLFPAASERDLLSRMIEILGPFPLTMLAASRRLQRYFKLESNTVSNERGYKLMSESEFEAHNQEAAPTARRYFDDSDLETIIGIRANTNSNGNLPLEYHCFLDFLRGLLMMDPKQRWNAEQAAMHPFITGAPFHRSFQPPTLSRQISRPVGIQSVQPSLQSASWHPNAAAAESYAHGVAMMAMSQLTGSVQSNGSFVGTFPTMGSVPTGNNLIGVSPEVNPIVMAAMRAAQEVFSNPSCPSTFQSSTQPVSQPNQLRIDGFHVAPRSNAEPHFSDFSQGRSLGTRHSRPMANINENMAHIDNDCEVSDVDHSLSRAFESCHIQPTSSTSLEQNNIACVTNEENSHFHPGTSMRSSEVRRGGLSSRHFFYGTSRESTLTSWQTPNAEPYGTPSYVFERPSQGMSNNASGLTFPNGTDVFAETFTSRGSSYVLTPEATSLPYNEELSSDGVVRPSRRNRERLDVLQCVDSEIQPDRYPREVPSPDRLFEESSLDY